MHHPDEDPKPYGEQIRLMLDSLPDPATDTDGYHYRMVEICRIAATAAVDVRNPSAGKHRLGS